jgi:ssDNA-binding Zn-finger/Zn-ribbon topoisomerase 1
MGTRKTNNTAARNRGKLRKICPKCEGNMIATKFTGYTTKGMYWKCDGDKNKDGCGEVISVQLGKELENRLLTGK